jgi:hypothetical protein
MIFALEATFVLLVAADTILTYKVIASGKGTEIGPMAKYYIDNKAAAIFITIVAVAFLIGWLRLVDKWWIVVPTYLAVYLRLGYLIRKHVRILNG